MPFNDKKLRGSMIDSCDLFAWSHERRQQSNESDESIKTDCTLDIQHTGQESAIEPQCMAQSVDVPSLLKRHEKLQTLIKRYNEAYYVHHQSLITDAEYDELYRELKNIQHTLEDQKIFDQNHTNHVDAARTHNALNRKNDVLKSVGADHHLLKRMGLETHRHKERMYSLDNAFSLDEVRDFSARMCRFLHIESECIEVVVEPKIDGLSLALTYQEGILKTLATRGDGLVGENVTQALDALHELMTCVRNAHGQKITDFSCELRAEAYMIYDNFHALNRQQISQGKEVFSTPRHATAGTLRHLNADVRQVRSLTYAIHGISDESWLTQNTYNARQEWLKSLGFLVAPYEIYSSLNDALAHLDALLCRWKNTLPYAIDGLVIKVNALRLASRLGHSSRAPRFAIAYKGLSTGAYARLLSIDVQVGRTGVLTPVGHVEPIVIDGVEITKATLHNAQDVHKKDIRVGDRVWMVRAGDVIPYIDHVDYSARLRDATPFTMPTSCPCCKGPIYQEDGEVAIKCRGGFDCADQAVMRLMHFVSRDALDIQGLGAKHIRHFHRLGVVRTPDDLFTLEERSGKEFDALDTWDGWGRRSAQKLFERIRVRRNISLHRLLVGFGIEHIGVQAAKRLSKNVTSLEVLRADVTKNDTSLIDLDGLGQKAIESLRHFFRTQQWIDALMQHITCVTENNDTDDYLVGDIPRPLSGEHVVFTGALFMSRQEAKTHAEALGATVQTSMSNITTLVICGEGAGSKGRAAAARGIRQMYNEDWKNFLKTHDRL